MAGQTHNGLFPGFSQNGWLSGLNGNAVKQKLACGFNDAAGGILHSDTAASGQQHGITFRNGLIDLLGKQRLIIHHNPIVDNMAPKCGEHCLQHGTVHVPHLSGAGLRLRRNQLVTGRNDAHGHFFHHRHLHPANGSQRTNVGRRQGASFVQNHLSGIHIIPPENQIHARRRRFGNTDGAVAVVLRVFHHHHTVSTPGHCAAGGNGYTFPLIQQIVGAFAHQHRGLQGQDRRDGIAAAEGVTGANRKAIHCGAVKIRHIFPRRNILRQNSAHSLRQSYKFCLFKRGKLRFYQRKNFFRRFYIQHTRPP